MVKTLPVNALRKRSITCFACRPIVALFREHVILLSEAFKHYALFYHIVEIHMDLHFKVSLMDDLKEKLNSK